MTLSLMTAGSKALRSLTHTGIFKIFLLSVALNAALLAAMVFGIGAAMSSFQIFSLGWVETMADTGATLASTLLAYFLFPVLMPIIISFFDEAIANVIEREEYPNIPTPTPPFWPTLAQDARFTVRALLLNLVCLPLYLIPLVNLVVYYTLNGYLLGYEFFNMVAGRHVGTEAGQALRKKHRLTLILAGAAITFAATVPFVNMVAGLWGVCMLIHLFHQMQPNYKAAR